MSEFDARMSAYREAVEAYLNGCFTEDLPQKRLFEAMRYSLLAAGSASGPCWRWNSAGCAAETGSRRCRSRRRWRWCTRTA